MYKTRDALTFVRACVRACVCVRACACVRACVRSHNERLRQRATALSTSVLNFMLCYEEFVCVEDECGCGLFVNVHAYLC